MPPEPSNTIRNHSFPESTGATVARYKCTCPHQKISLFFFSLIPITPKQATTVINPRVRTILILQ